MSVDIASGTPREEILNADRVCDCREGLSSRITKGNVLRIPTEAWGIIQASYSNVICLPGNKEVCEACCQKDRQAQLAVKESAGYLKQFPRLYTVL